MWHWILELCCWYTHIYFHDFSLICPSLSPHRTMITSMTTRTSQRWTPSSRAPLAVAVVEDGTTSPQSARPHWWPVRSRSTSRAQRWESRCPDTNAWGDSIRNSWWLWRTSWRPRWMNISLGLTKNWRRRETTSAAKQTSLARSTRPSWRKRWVDETTLDGFRSHLLASSP